MTFDLFRSCRPSRNLSRGLTIDRPRYRLIPAALLTAAMAGGLGAAPAASAAPVSALTPEQAEAAAVPGARFRDRVLPAHPRPVAHAASASVNPKDRFGVTRGGLYTGRSGSDSATLRIYVSNRFATWDRSLNQLWANRFVAMLHGSEISSLKVYISPLAEIRSPAVCGSWADSCYDPNDGTMYLTGEVTEDGADIVQIAMHEYAHHIAANRLNTPWDALSWGPKHWASAQKVCSYSSQRLMWPGDAWNHYEDHPGEIWAETYRLVTSAHQSVSPDPWEILNPRWNPAGSQSILAAAGLDVTFPWKGHRVTTATGSLGASGSQSVTTTIPMALDGRVSATLSVKGSLKTKLEILSPSGSRIGSTAATSAVANACSVSSARVVVRRVSGTGTWSLRVLSP